MENALKQGKHTIREDGEGSSMDPKSKRNRTLNDSIGATGGERNVPSRKGEGESTKKRLVKEAKLEGEEDVNVSFDRERQVSHDPRGEM